MRRSNGNFNIAPPRENLGHLTIFYARGVWNLTDQAFHNVVNLNPVWVGCGKLSRKCQVWNDFFFSGAEVANRELKQTRRRRKQERHLKM